ncbi:MAG: TolC family protein [Methylococcaceae bacterium]|nr:TolC family protein [Methylococcaceae bacterium]
MNRLAAIFLFLARAVYAQVDVDVDPSPALQDEVRQTKTGALGLEQALDLAFEHNPDLQAAQERIGQAEARVAEATAAFYPKLTGRVGYTYSNDPAMAFSAIVSQRRYGTGQNINQPGFVENFRPEIVGSMSLYRGGQDYYRKKAAELGVEAAELERAAFRNRLAASVTAAYYAVLAAPKQVEAAQHSIEAVDSELKNARIQHQEGALLKSDVLSLEVRRAQAAETELRALNAVELARSGLRILLGLETTEPMEIRESAEPLAARQDSLTGLITQALAQRPEMLAATRQVEMREQELRAEEGGHLPRVNAYAAYGLNERSPEFNFNRDNLTMGVSAEVDLFAGGATSARVAGAERKLAETRAIRERTRLEIEDEVRKAQANLSEARQRRQVAEAATVSADEALRLVREQYRAGVATVTRYLEAEADRAQSEIHAVTARYDAQVARANLQQAIGSGFQSALDPAGRMKPSTR